MKGTTILALLAIVISFAIAFYLYPKMPESMASHWNANGEVDGYMPRLGGMFFMPSMALCMLFLFIWLPTLDPLKNNVKKFRRYYDGFILLIILFFLYIYLLTVVWSLSYRFNMSFCIMPAIAILFYYIGILTENAKRNWFIGIRTPWTLSSDIVWEKTHRLGGRLFKWLALIVLIGMFFGENITWFVLVPVLAVTVYIIAYSYFEYKKYEKRNKTLD